MNRWMPMAFCAMFLNGAVLTVLKCLPAAFTNHFLVLVFVVSGLVSWTLVAVASKRVRLVDFAIGAAAGAMSYVGNVFLIRSLSMGKASLVFPVVFGSSMVIVTLVSAIGFKEKLTPRGICAVVVGIVSVVVLRMS
jgi:drug/metabolite transporter (DMT)-like permease